MTIQAGVLCAIAGVASGCATIVTGTHSDVQFSTNPMGATISVVNFSGESRFEGTTPAIVSLRATEGPFTVWGKNNDGLHGFYVVRKEMTGWVAGNCLFGLAGLLIGGVTDLISGGAYVLPQNVVVRLNNRPLDELQEEAAAKTRPKKKAPKKKEKKPLGGQSRR